MQVSTTSLEAHIHVFLLYLCNVCSHLLLSKRIALVKFSGCFLLLLFDDRGAVWISRLEFFQTFCWIIYHSYKLSVTSCISSSSCLKFQLNICDSLNSLNTLLDRYFGLRLIKHQLTSISHLKLFSQLIVWETAHLPVLLMFLYLFLYLVGRVFSLVCVHNDFLKKLE